MPARVSRIPIDTEPPDGLGFRARGFGGFGLLVATKGCRGIFLGEFPKMGVAPDPNFTTYQAQEPQPKEALLDKAWTPQALKP